ncbi:MAG TPA: inositol monophosphatase family protein [Gammaproteobacteria bacterium]|nr:inositol monophosphatase family protein [Gammaproteobacteria bacterium]
MAPLLNIAVRAARRAGDIIVRHLGRLESLEVASKSRNEFVTQVDRLAEQDIVQTIRHSYPDHGILAEEGGRHDGRDSEFLWIIDPLDGTTNFIHGFPVFSVSVALQHRGRLEHGVIYDPLRQELFTASRGEGAQLDGRRIRVSRTERMERALIGTGFPYRSKGQWVDQYFDMLRAVMDLAAGVRRPGSAALDLACVAAGRFDGFWEFGLQPWDIAAGVLLIREAGGLVGGLTGADDFHDTGNIVAGNPKIYAALLETIGPCLTGAAAARAD